MLVRVNPPFVFLNWSCWIISSSTRARYNSAPSFKLGIKTIMRIMTSFFTQLVFRSKVFHAESILFGEKSSGRHTAGVLTWRIRMKMRVLPWEKLVKSCLDLLNEGPGGPGGILLSESLMGRDVLGARCLWTKRAARCGKARDRRCSTVSWCATSP